MKPNRNTVDNECIPTPWSAILFSSLHKDLPCLSEHNHLSGIQSAFISSSCVCESAGVRLVCAGCGSMFWVASRPATHSFGLVGPEAIKGISLCWFLICVQSIFCAYIFSHLWDINLQVQSPRLFLKMATITTFLLTLRWFLNFGP